MSFLVTGVAGFIGFHVAQTLLQRGERVVGIDSVNDYYSVALKRDRLALLAEHSHFTFHQVDIGDFESLRSTLKDSKFRKVIHLAAQAGVRYSMENPHVYIHSNVAGQVNILELCRHQDGFEGLAYASSSSVYGGTAKMPSSELDRVDTPISLYAATKKSNELIGHVYSHLYGVPQVGLRFFTVYGPWGRPDMAMWLFADAILAGKPIKVFNYGKMRRDFTYIDDIVSGVLKVIANPKLNSAQDENHRIYNIGNNRVEDLLHMIGLLERALGHTARMEMLPLQPGDVPESYADISAIQRDYGFEPTTPISKGIPLFIDWYKSYHMRG